jgi:hypothetical protein
MVRYLYSDWPLCVTALDIKNDFQLHACARRYRSQDMKTFACYINIKQCSFRNTHNAEYLPIQYFIINIIYDTYSLGPVADFMKETLFLTRDKSHSVHV